MFGRILAVILFGLCFWGSVGAASAQSCSDIQGRMKIAREAPDLDALSRLNNEVSTAAANCSSEARLCLPRYVVSGFIDAAQASAGNGASSEEVVAILERGRSIYPTWQVLVALADIANDSAKANHDPQAYQRASFLYQSAIDDIKETTDCSAFGSSGVPTSSTIERIARKMQTAVMLAPELVVTINRGECGGVFETGVRGFEPEARPLPITFPYDKTSFTDAGAKGAQTLLDCLKTNGYTKIVLSGHTDDHGTDAYNNRLSAGRLETVKTFLLAGGFKGSIELLPKGRSEPFQIDDPEAHTQDEIDQANRRVELRKTEP